jgi:RNA polymerase sigma-70 factor (ECF subfamily)
LKNRIVDKNDEALFRQYTSGDESALVRLLERYSKRVASLVRNWLGRHSPWADDITQDVFVQVYRGTPRFEGRSSFKTWLYSIVANVCHDHSRREKRTPTVLVTDADTELSLAELPDKSLDPLQVLESDERVALVRTAVARLKPAQRTILELRDGKDLSYDAIARMLAIPVGTVRSRLHNARAALAKELCDLIER